MLVEFCCVLVQMLVLFSQNYIGDTYVTFLIFREIARSKLWSWNRTGRVEVLISRGSLEKQLKFNMWAVAINEERGEGKM